MNICISDRNNYKIMIQVGTHLKIMDNSGEQTAKCIRIKNKKRANVGDTILVAIQTALPKHRVKKGDLHSAIVIQTKKFISRPDGGTVRNTQNSILLLNEKGSPLGTRVTSPFNFEIRNSSFRVWALSQYAH